MPQGSCPVEGCNWVGRLNGGLCGGHYEQKYRGKPFTKIVRFDSVEDRFWSKVQRGTDDECWEWLGCLTSTGYGQFASRELPAVGRKAHRHAFRFTYGYLNPETILDHQCRNRKCVNPRHLREVTIAENSENMGVRKDNKSGYRGVHWDKKYGRWVARINKNGKLAYSQSFSTKEEAAEAARLKRLEIYTHNELDK